jgi:hypothetical protein
MAQIGYWCYQFSYYRGILVQSHVDSYLGIRVTDFELSKDGNFIELYDRPEESPDGPVPDNY